jgi:transcriptional regulator with XRE-family HTH domain
MLDKAAREENDFYSQFGKNVRSCRGDLNLTQEELSARLNLSRSSIANIELGRQKILLHQLFDLAKALEVDPLDLVRKPDERDLVTQLRARDYSEPVIDWANRVRALADETFHE